MNPEIGPKKEVPREEGAEAHKEYLLARVTFSRHEETNYTGVGKDITDRGAERAREKGQKITKEKGAPSVIGHSPQKRALGTAESIAEGAQQEADTPIGPRFIRVPGIRTTGYYDAETRKELDAELGTSQHAWANAHYDDPKVYNNPDKVETNEEKRSRMYREFERLIASLLKNETVPDKVPHIVFVSHYEIITLLLDDVFGIDTFDSKLSPSYGEHVDIEIFSKNVNGDIPFSVSYAGHTKRVLFDRKLRRPVAE